MIERQHEVIETLFKNAEKIPFGTASVEVNNHRQRRWLDRVSKRDLAVVRGLR